MRRSHTRQSLSNPPGNPRFHKRADRFFEELEWYATALRDARSRPCPRSESDTAQLVLKK